MITWQCRNIFQLVFVTCPNFLVYTLKENRFKKGLRLRLHGSCITIFVQIITVTSLSKSMRAMKCTQYIPPQHRYPVRAIPKRQCPPFTAGRNCNAVYRGFTVLPAEYKATADVWVDISLTSCTSMEIRHEIAKWVNCHHTYRCYMVFRQFSGNVVTSFGGCCQNFATGFFVTFENLYW